MHLTRFDEEPRWLWEPPPCLEIDDDLAQDGYDEYVAACEERDQTPMEMETWVSDHYADYERAVREAAEERHWEGVADDRAFWAGRD